MSQKAIPYLFMRGGTSRGPYFNASDLPKDRDHLSEILCTVVGSGHALNIDGIGGGNPVTTKVAILSRSEDEWAEIDYFFAQVSVETRLVDFKPTCGNILSGVGAAAIEMGLIEAQDGKTTIKIRAVNTGAKIETQIQTPRGVIDYSGDQHIDGVPGTAAPVLLKFQEVAGSSLGKTWPTGRSLDHILGHDVTCIEVAMPMVIGRAVDFGITCQEDAVTLDANQALFEKIEKIRIEAAKIMGMGDARKSVTPKFGLLAPAQNGGDISARYFMPWTTHPSLAVTGSQAMAACALAKGTIADGMLARRVSSPARLMIEHPLGQIEVITEYSSEPFAHISAGLVRSCRLLARGEVMIPTSLWRSP